MNGNRKAFLDMIAFSEGTAGKGDNGYNVIVGGGLFHSYRDHPRQRIWLPRWGLYSTAAGRYQLLARYWDVYSHQMKLKDFSPESQDAVALQQIRERHALEDVDAGRFDQAINKVRNIWASLPGAGYGQREETLERLRAAYVSAGGQLLG